MSRTRSSLTTGLAALLVAGLLSACGAADSETPNPEGGAVTVPDQSETTPPAESGTAAPEDPADSDDGAEAVKPEVEGIGMDEAAQIAIDEFGGELDGIERSEEHTSELQSRGHLVCRLLLEKK